MDIRRGKEEQMDPVVHFELPATDRERMASFYQSAFGWKAQMFGPEMRSYTVVTTTESDENGRPTTPGSINGGFYMRTDDPTQAPSVVIAVDDANQAIAKIKAAGGEILSGPDEIPGVGLYVSFRDTEGNRMSVLQPNSR
jgi:predicted enzyme related to lactoylglutathione lyase